jgi:hypothetical protein
MCNFLQRPVDRNLIVDYGETLEMNGNEFRLNDAQDHQTLRKVFLVTLQMVRVTVYLAHIYLPANLLY